MAATFWILILTLAPTDYRQGGAIHSIQPLSQQECEAAGKAWVARMRDAPDWSRYLRAEFNCIKVSR